MKSVAVDSYMNNNKKVLYKKIYDTNIGRWTCSIMVTTILFLVTSVIFNRTFYTNDDENIMYTLAGFYTNGVPQDHHFINVILSIIIRFFYGIEGSIPWYPLFHLLLLWSSSVVLYNCILEVCNKGKINIIIANVLAVLAYFGIVLYITILLQFTTTSACAGGAAVLLILSINLNEDTKKKILSRTLLACLFLLACYMLRKNSGMVVFCFFYSSVVYKFIEYKIKKEKSNNKNAKLFFIINVIGIMCIVAATFANSIIRSGTEWDAFFEFEDTRYKMTDYPHDTYYENPELYESIDWSEELYVLAGQYWWFFMDENINSDSFQAISDTGYYDVDIEKEEVLINFKDLFLDNKITSFYLAVGVLCLLIYFLLFIIKKDKKINSIIELLFLGCMFMGATILCLYLCIKGRFIQRAFHSIIIPYLFICVYMMIKIFSELYCQLHNKFICMGAVILGSVCFCFGVYEMLGVAKLETQSRINKSHNTLYIEEYAMARKENIYIYDTSLTFRYMPFVDYEGDYPDNLFFWGGMGWKSPAFNEQLRINGLTDLYSDVLLEENVYYITKEDYLPGGKSMGQRMYDYMSRKYENLGIYVVENLDKNIIVYKFYLKQ